MGSTVITCATLRGLVFQMVQRSTIMTNLSYSVSSLDAAYLAVVIREVKRQDLQSADCLGGPVDAVAANQSADAYFQNFVAAAVVVAAVYIVAVVVRATDVALTPIHPELTSQ